MKTTPEDAWRAYQDAECIHDKGTIQNALDGLATDITNRFAGTNPVCVCVLHGGLYTAAELISRLGFPLQQDYLHASRYRGQTTGGTLNWISRPQISLKDRHVLLIDDIHDEGMTLASIVSDCKDAGAAEVLSAVLVNKIHGRKQGTHADFSGLDVPDRYVFGCGMDYQGYLRNLPAVYALKGR